MKELLFWLLPPVIGAIIGYVTNVVAIKMLFRPLKEVKVFGIPIPFTPGILPRQRYILAKSIGGMVERELLTPEILRARLTLPDVREGLRAALAQYTGRLFNLPAKEWIAGISDYVITGAQAAWPKAAEALISFLRQKEIRENLEVQLRIFISRTILKMNVFQRFFITAGQYGKTLDEKIPDIVEDLLDQAEALFRSNEGEKKVIESLEKEIRSFPIKYPDLTLEKMLVPGKSWIGEAPKERLDSFLTDKILDTTCKQTEALLGTINVKKLVSDRIDSLDMLRVEKIILDVLAGQLWWINVFGGILGALIGFSQVILSLFL